MVLANDNSYTELSTGAPLLKSVGIVVLCLATAMATAWPRKKYSEGEIVSRAQVIVIAKIQEGSLTLIPHLEPTGETISWEHHMNLIVSEWLKGTNSSRIIKASIHYGLEPIVGGYKSNHYGIIVITNVARWRVGYPPQMIQIFDIGSSPTTLTPITGDLRTNHIWLLRSTTVGGNSPLLAVHDPEDIQRIEKRTELLDALHAVEPQ